ncbi:metalloregulator ArsR/SmtB family transcription factor [Budvicia aquatica]|uniref:Arsenical resistance operon repressor n=1 Tax=Budvicia aquatica TaxID=82979 RepID=A0A2C6DHJ2_9GAMM|nr:metalloregulator ArsR/SmtB family transcription factor [Budvicia aquatica]PHI30676.1 transcriptional regulator [Budvicia aquatica]VFS50223.1 HTH-type transcriptional repressor AseR [Budvicia aquatica]
MSPLTPLQLFKCLSDETRLTIVLLLKQATELCVCELCETLDLPQPKISRHLAMLRENGILLDRRAGKWIHYRLSHNMPMWAGAIIEQAYQSQELSIKTLSKRLKNVSGSTTNRVACL